MALTQPQLLAAVADRAELPKAEAKRVLDALEEVVLDELANAQKVRIGGLVQLTVRVKPATKKRPGRNPATGEQITIAAKPARRGCARPAARQGEGRAALGPESSPPARRLKQPHARQEPSAPKRPVGTRALAHAGVGRSSGAGGEPPAVRLGKSGESSTIQLTEEDYLVAIQPLGPSDERPLDRAHMTGRLLEERTLLEELWRISHFGWIPEAVIRRALTLAGGREIPADSLHHALRRLLDRGWVDHDAGEKGDGEQHWRLTDSARHVRVS